MLPALIGLCARVHTCAHMLMSTSLTPLHVSGVYVCTCTDEVLPLTSTLTGVPRRHPGTSQFIPKCTCWGLSSPWVLSLPCYTVGDVATGLSWSRCSHLASPLPRIRKIYRTIYQTARWVREEGKLHDAWAEWLEGPSAESQSETRSPLKLPFSLWVCVPRMD